MSVEELVKRLRDMGGGDHAVKTYHKAADKLEELAAEVERCHARLEIDRHYVPNETGDDFDEVLIPFHEREKSPDGIEARDATIKGQDEQLFALRKWRQEYIGKLTIAEAALAEKDKEIDAAKHDIERQIKVLVEQSDEITALEARCRELEREREYTWEKMKNAEVYIRVETTHAEGAEAYAQKLRGALERLINACHSGKRVERGGGAGGMTLESQLHRTSINGVPAMAVEDAYEALTLTSTSALAAVCDEVREECAKISEETNGETIDLGNNIFQLTHATPDEIAAAIRARKETGE